MSEKIEDIVRDIRRSQNGNVHTISAKEAYELADCIEKAIEVERIEWRKMLKEAKDAIEVLEQKCDAVEQCQTEDATCQESLQVGNAAAMYEALKAVVKVGYPHNFQHEAPHICGYCYEITTAIDKCFAALAASPRNCDIMSLNTARKVWFTKEILPRLDGDLPLGKEVPFEEWFVSQHEEGKSK